MTLYELLAKLKCDHYISAADNICNNDTFRERLGRMKMCNELFELLSDETLNMEVKTRTEVLKGE